LGKELASHLKIRGHEIIPMVRKRGQDGIFWNPETGEIDLAALEGTDVVVHLAGESIASKRWTTDLKNKIMMSRVQGTTLLAESLKKLNRPPQKFLSASAVGFYADGGDQPLLENAPSDHSFLSEVCIAWERASHLAKPICPVINFRIGVVLTNQGGALQKMLPPFRLGLGGKLGDGKQYMPWIDLQDLCGALEFLIHQPNEHAVYNLTAPQPATQEAFARTLGQLLNRPHFLNTPKWALKAAMGEMAEELLLKSLRVMPDHLLKAGFKFEYGELEASLRRWI